MTHKPPSSPVALQPKPLLSPPRPGFCHAARCDDPSRFVVRVRRLTGAWTSGVDYCEQHAHEVARRMRETMKVVVEPLAKQSDDPAPTFPDL